MAVALPCASGHSDALRWGCVSSEPEKRTQEKKVHARRCIVDRHPQLFRRAADVLRDGTGHHGLGGVCLPGSKGHTCAGVTVSSLSGSSLLLALVTHRNSSLSQGERRSQPSPPCGHPGGVRLAVGRDVRVGAARPSELRGRDSGGDFILSQALAMQPPCFGELRARHGRLLPTREQRVVLLPPPSHLRCGNTAEIHAWRTWLLTLPGLESAPLYLEFVCSPCIMVIEGYGRLSFADV